MIVKGMRVKQINQAKARYGWVGTVVDYEHPSGYIVRFDTAELNVYERGDLRSVRRSEVGL